MTELREKHCRMPVGFRDGPRIACCLVRFLRRLSEKLLLNRSLDM